MNRNRSSGPVFANHRSMQIPMKMAGPLGQGRGWAQGTGCGGRAELTVGARDEAVVVGVHHRRVEHAIHQQQAGGLVQLVLDLGAAGDLNHCGGGSRGGAGEQPWGASTSEHHGRPRPCVREHQRAFVPHACAPASRAAHPACRAAAAGTHLHSESRAPSRRRPGRARGGRGCGCGKAGDECFARFSSAITPLSNHVCVFLQS